MNDWLNWCCSQQTRNKGLQSRNLDSRWVCQKLWYETNNLMGCNGINNMILGLSKSRGFHPIYHHFDREDDEQSLEPGWLAEACSTIKIC